MDDWLDQLQAELEKQAADRSATLESLFVTGDYEAIKDWISEWEMEDKTFDSLRSRYQQSLSLSRIERQLNQRLSLENTGAEFSDRTH